ncbi:MAG: hypothetical protein SNJ29_15905 [Rikenellaceae bacterium]
MKPNVDIPQLLREATVRLHELGDILATTNPGLCEVDMENYSDSYKYLRLNILDAAQSDPQELLALGVEDFPNDSLAGILLGGLKTGLPKEVLLKGLSIDRNGKSFHFCISGSISLEDLQSLCEDF